MCVFNGLASPCAEHALAKCGLGKRFAPATSHGVGRHILCALGELHRFNGTCHCARAAARTSQMPVEISVTTALLQGHVARTPSPLPSFSEPFAPPTLARTVKQSPRPHDDDLMLTMMSGLPQPARHCRHNATLLMEQRLVRFSCVLRRALSVRNGAGESESPG